MVYQESHDEERLMYNNEQYGNGSGSYSIKDKSTGLQRNGMAAAFWSMLPGPKMLWEFGELGYDYSINTCANGTVDGSGNCRTDPKPSGWPYLTDTARKRLHDVYASMLRLRTLYPGLAAPSSITSSLGGGFKSLQVSTDSLSVTVIGNFDVVPGTGSVTFQNAGTWFNYFTGEPFTATVNAQSFTLAPGEYRVYVNKNVTNTVTTAIGNVNVDPNPFNIMVYPNPTVNGNATVSYQLPGYGKTSLTVTDFQGRILGSLELGDQAGWPAYVVFGRIALSGLLRSRAGIMC